MRLYVVACGVLEPELRALAEESPHEVHLHILDAGLHSEPERLRTEVQNVLDTCAGCDAVVLGYGLCGRGVSGLVPVTVPLVLPRAHDCMTLFLGSRAAYGAQFKAHPGTFYITAGWYEKSVAPKQAAEPDVLRVFENAERDPRYPALAQEYGGENARFIIQFMDGWKRNYTRLAFIDTGAANSEKYETYARNTADALGWRYERIPGDLHLLRALLFGDWERDDILVVKPGQRCLATGGDEIVSGVDRVAPREEEFSPAPDEPHHAEPRKTQPQSRCEVITESRAGRQIAADEPLIIGVDAGGTYTDAAICALRDGTLMSKAKALTTPHDLAVGIRGALEKLSWPDARRIAAVAVSTTLATNAIAENKGGLPGLLLMPGVGGAEVDWPLQRSIPGLMGITGEEIRPIDEDATKRAIDELVAAGADAFAVVGYASVRNPAHELGVRELVRERCSVPVVCGHELSLQLNVIARAYTTVLNARLFPPVRELMATTRRMMKDFGVDAPLWVVKGDGSLMNEATALARPIDTLLSGPAASVAGALHLAGARDALVMDMGGTTTDTALLENGMTRLNEEGIHVNGLPLHVVAADISTIGLGGDSRVDFTPDRRIAVGPDRAIPLCLLADRYPHVAEELARLDAAAVGRRDSSRALEYLVLRREPPAGLYRGRDKAAIDALREGPLTRKRLALRLGLPSEILLVTRHLEARGIVVRSALTPTDVLHARGQYTAWNVEAARHALRVFAELYGASVGDMGEAVLDKVVRKLCALVVAREMGIASDSADSRRILDNALSAQPSGELVFRVRYERPIVAIGAPAAAYFPEVARRLDARVIVPAHAEVANAVGAAVSRVLVREVVSVMPSVSNAYIVCSRVGRTEYEKLGPALEAAECAAREIAERRALESGAESCEVDVKRDVREVYTGNGEKVFVQALVEATASGRAAVRV